MWLPLYNKTSRAWWLVANSSAESSSDFHNDQPWCHHVPTYDVLCCLTQLFLEYFTGHFQSKEQMKPTETVKRCPIYCEKAGSLFEFEMSECQGSIKFRYVTSINQGWKAILQQRQPVMSSTKYCIKRLRANAYSHIIGFLVTWLILIVGSFTRLVTLICEKFSDVVQIYPW